MRSEVANHTCRESLTGLGYSDESSGVKVSEARLALLNRWLSTYVISISPGLLVVFKNLSDHSQPSNSSGEGAISIEKCYCKG